MKKNKLYRYVGRNGLITSPVLLDDIKHYIYYSLFAEESKILTNGEEKRYYTTIPEEELSEWYEIEDIG